MKKTLFWLLFSTVIVSFLLASCAPGPVPLAATATKTKTPLPTATKTKTPLPTATKTKTPTPTKTPTRDPFYTPPYPAPPTIGPPVTPKPTKPWVPKTSVFMPIIENVKHQACLEIGGEHALSAVNKKALLDAGIRCVKTDFTFWNELEPVRGQRVWTGANIKQFETNIKWYKDNRIRVYVQFIGSPRWARSGENECLPVIKEFWPDYAKMIIDVMKRNTHIQSIEIWNEPDASAGAPAAMVSLDPPPLVIYGCWGKVANDYWDFFQVSRTAVRNVFPQTDVRHGGLMFINVSQFEFLRAAHNKRVQLDEIVIHHYSYWDGADGINEAWALAAKLAAIKSLYPWTPIILNETGVISDYGNCSDPRFQATAARINLHNLTRFSQTTFYRYPSSGWRCVNVGPTTATYLGLKALFGPSQ